MSSKTQPSIGFVIVTNELDEGNPSNRAVKNFIRIYREYVEAILIFGPQKASLEESITEVHCIGRHEWPTVFLDILEHVIFQLKLTSSILRQGDDCEITFFHLGGSILVLPLLVCRILDRKPILIITGSIGKSYAQMNDNSFFTTVIVSSINILEWITSRLATRVVFLSESMKQDCNYTIEGKNVVANLNFVDTTEFKNDKGEKERSFDFIFVGRFESVKGIEKFIQAVSILAKDLPGMKVALVGDGSLRSKVERIVVQQDIEQNVNFAGWVKPEEVPEYLREAKFLVIPSESEGLPKILLEGMSCGTVPITTPVGGIPDIIHHRERGFLLSDNDPQVMAKELREILRNANWEDHSQQSRAYIEANYSLEECKNEYQQLFEEVV